MEASNYTTLTRQSGLVQEMRVIANNIANIATNGYREEGVIFSEFMRQTAFGEGISMAAARVRDTSFAQGSLKQTGAPLDLAIEGDGFFLVETPQGERLTRSGAFTPNGQGDLVTIDGYRVLDAGGAPLFIPPDAGRVEISSDGTISAADRLIGQIGIVEPFETADLFREDGVLFRAENGVVPVINPRMLQGFLEQSNVNQVGQLARMIEVQRSYELGQSFLEAEDKRVKNALQTLIK